MVDSWSEVGGLECTMSRLKSSGCAEGVLGG